MSCLFRGSACFWVMLTFVLGCSDSVPQIANSGDYDKLLLITNAYRQADIKLGRPPKNRAELKPFLEHTSDLNELFTSNNDGQPYVILWGVVMDPNKVELGIIGHPAVVAFEKEGKDGYRYVATIQAVELMDADQFEQATIPADKRP